MSGALSPSRTRVIGGGSSDRKSSPGTNTRSATSGTASGAADARPPASDALELDLISVIPPAPPASALQRPTFGAGRDDVDSAFEQLASGTAPPGAAAVLVDQSLAKAENGELFRQMAVGHAQPVREFMLELVVGATTKQWVAMAAPAIDMLRKGADAMEQHELVSALAEYRAALHRASESAGPRIAGAERDALLAAYAHLATALPLAFDLTSHRRKREPLLVHALLQQVPGLHKVAIDKLYSAGLASLDALCRSSAADLMGLGKLDADTAQAICSRFQIYWRERTEEPLQRAEAHALRKLKSLLDALTQAHDAFQRAEADEDRESKRRARSDRQARCLDVNVLLVQLGEVDLVEDLERSPTDVKISRVREYIERPGAAMKQAAQETA